MKRARAELLAAVLWLAPIAARAESAPELELLDFLGEDDAALQIADAELGEEPDTAPRRREPAPQAPSRSKDHEVPEPGKN